MVPPQNPLHNILMFAFILCMLFLNFNFHKQGQYVIIKTSYLF